MNYAPSILGNIAATKGWDVTLHHYSHLDTDSDIEEALTKDRPDIVALSFLLFGRNLAFRIASVAKKMNIKVIAGGSHPTACPDDLVLSGMFDAVIIGDGMGVMDEILDGISDINGDVIYGKKHHDISLYTKRYFSDELKERIIQTKTIELLSSLGCPYNCYFCANTTKYSKIPNDILINSIVNAKKNYDIERLFVFDDMFVTNKNNIRDFRIQIEKLGYSFSYKRTQLRANIFNDEIAEELKLLGVEELTFGIETASERLLKFINKRISIEDIYRAAEICKKFNFAFNIYLMVGLPTQDKSDYEKTLEYVRQISPNNVHVYVFIPFPNTYLFNYCMDNGFIVKPIDYSNYLEIDPYSSEFTSSFIKPALSKIDYQMAHYYKHAFEMVIKEKQEDFIKSTLEKADKNKWILFGTDDFFYFILDKVNQYSFHNCIGYYDYDYQNGHKGRIYGFDNMVPRFNIKKINHLVDIIVITVHKQGKFYQQFIRPLLRKKIGFQGHIISVSTFNNT